MRLAGALLLLAAVAAPQAPLRTVSVVEPAKGPALSFQAMAGMEKELDSRIAMANTADRMLLLGNARLLYLPGFGAVITQELSLVATPVIYPFHPVITPEEKVKVHERKIQQLPVLKKTMREMWAAAASSLADVPPTEQVVLAIKLLYQPWENTSGLPAQLVIRGARNPAAADALPIEEQ